MNTLKREYLRGFKDAPNNTYRPPDTIEDRAAYALGWEHWLAGDDISSVDKLPWDGIEKLIEQKLRRYRNGARSKET